MSDLTVALDEMAKLRPHYLRARNYYEGVVPEYFGNRRMRRAIDAVSDRFKLNLAKTPVNAVADRLEVAAVTVPNSDPLTSILQTEVWDANELLFEVPGILRNACIYGDSYVLVWDTPGDQEGVEVSYNSPLEGRMMYDKENPRHKAYYVHTWTENGTRYADVFYSDRLEQWYQDEKREKPDDERQWHMRTTSFREPTPQELTDPTFNPDDLGIWPIPNEYGEVPAFHLRTDRPWGTPVHRDAYGPQDAITKIVAAHMSTVDFQTFPQRYALEEAGVDTDELDDEDWDEALDNLSTSGSAHPSGGLRAGSGEVWWLKGVKGVGQFDVANPDVFMKPADFYMRMMAQTTETPLHLFDPSGDQPSGESRRAAMDTLVKKVRTLSQSFGSALSSALEFSMKVLGHGDVKVDTRWRNPESVGDKDSWDTSEVKIRSGVPVKHVLMEQGYTEEQAEAWTTTSSDQDLTRKVELLDKIGDAVQKLGAGVGFGVVTTEQVASIIGTVLDSDAVDA